MNVGSLAFMALVSLWILMLVRRVARVRRDIWQHTAPGSAELGPIDAETIAEVYARLYRTPPPARVADTPVRRPAGPSHPVDAAPVRLTQVLLPMPDRAPGPPEYRSARIC
jgi:hypothetical protein